MGEGARHEQKPTADVYLLCTGMHLIQFYLTRQGTTEHFHTKPPEKNRAREPLLVLGAWVTEGSQEAVQVTLPPLMMARRSSVSDPCCPWLEQPGALSSLASSLLGSPWSSGLHCSLSGQVWPATCSEE